MMRDRLGIRGARRRSIATRPGERGELVERTEISRILAQHLDVGLLGGFVLSLTGERARTLESLGDAQRLIHAARRSGVCSHMVDTLAPRTNHDLIVMKRNAAYTVRKNGSRFFSRRADGTVWICRQLKIIVNSK
jgi:hypothetical protein